MYRYRQRVMMLWAIGLVYGTGALMAQQPAPLPQGDARLVAARAALEDGLYALVQKQAEGFLDAHDDLEASAAREATLLLLEALHAQGQHEVVLKRASALRGRWARAGQEDALIFWLALAQHGLDRCEKALALTETFDDDYPDSPYRARVARLRAWCQWQSGEAETAIAAFSSFAASHPDDAEADINLLEWGKALLAVGQFEDARGPLETLAGQSRTNSLTREGRYWLGRSHLVAQEWAVASNAFATLLSDGDLQERLRARVWFAMADVHEGLGEPEGAARALREGITAARDPLEQRQGNLRLGRLLLAGGDVTNAVPLLKSLIAADPGKSDSEAAQLYLSAALLDQGRHAQAADEYQHYLETFTNSLGIARACRGKGWALLSLERYAEAAGSFLKAHELLTDPEARARCLFKAGDAYFANKQFKLARDAYAGARGEYPEAEFRPEILFQLGECAARLGETDEAETLLRQLPQEFPLAPVSQEALLRVGQMLGEQQRWQDAIDTFDELMSTYPGSAFYAEALHAKAMVEYRLFHFDRSLEHLQRIVTDFPDSPLVEQAYFQRGMCNYWLGRDEQALKTCESFLERYPDSRHVADVVFWLAKYHFNRSEYEWAEHYMRRFAADFPQQPLADEALYWAAVSAAGRKEYVTAVDLINQLIKDYPLSTRIPEARFSQADALSMLAKPAGAILIFDEIINKYTDSWLVAAAWGRKGDCQFTLGAEDPERYKESIESYRIAANDPEADLDLVMQAEYKIGRSLEKLGRIDDAFEQYYVRLVVRYFEDLDRGIRHNAASRVWFTRAAFAAADIMQDRDDWRRVVDILERVIEADVEATQSARDRIKDIRAERWWLFY